MTEDVLKDKLKDTLGEGWDVRTEAVLESGKIYLHTTCYHSVSGIYMTPIFDPNLDDNTLDLMLYNVKKVAEENIL